MEPSHNPISFLVPIAMSLFVTSAFGQANFWEPASGIFVRTQVNATSFASNNIVLAGSNNGLFRSTDAGETWIASNNGLGDSVVLSLLFDVGTGLFAGTRTGAYRSTDDGLTWHELTGFPQIPVHSLVSDSIGLIFAATDSGVYRSTDAANSWTQTNAGLTATRMTSLDVNSGGVLFGGTLDSGVFRSTDRGATWTQTALSKPYVNTIVVSSSGSVFAWASNEIYRSIDSGNTWTSFGFPDPNSLATNPSGAIFVGTAFCVSSPLCGSQQPGGLYRSTDDGNTWSYIGFSYSNFIVLTSNLENRLLGQLETGALYHSTDNGSSWQQNSLRIDAINVLMIRPDGALFAGGYIGCFRSTDRGNTWTNRSPGAIAHQVLSLGTHSPNYLFAGTVAWGVYRSTDDGGSWTRQVLDLQHYYDVLALASDSSGYVFAGTYPEGVFRTSDNGDNWMKVNNGLGNLTVRCLATTSSDDVLAGTDLGIYHTSNHGDSWSRLDGGFIGSVQTIQTFPPGNILVGTYLDGIYRSTDNGTTWVQSNSGLTNLDVRSVMSITPAVFFAGTSGGIFASTDTGYSWVATNTGLTNIMVRSLAHKPGGNIYAGTWGGGVFRSTELVSSILEVPASFPASYILKQNYPNPFNPNTTIEFTISHASFVKLYVFNVLGKVVQTLVSGVLQSGNYKTTWDASGYSSGVYFYSLQVYQTTSGKTARFSQTKKLLLIR